MPFERGTQLCMLTCCLEDNIQLFPKYGNDEKITKIEVRECVWFDDFDKSPPEDVDDQDEHDAQVDEAEKSATKPEAKPSQIAACPLEYLAANCVVCLFVI